MRGFSTIFLPACWPDWDYVCERERVFASTVSLQCRFYISFLCVYMFFFNFCPLALHPQTLRHARQLRREVPPLRLQGRRRSTLCNPNPKPDVQHCRKSFESVLHMKVPHVVVAIPLCYKVG